METTNTLGDKYDPKTYSNGFWHDMYSKLKTKKTEKNYYNTENKQEQISTTAIGKRTIKANTNDKLTISGILEKFKNIAKGKFK